MLDQLPVTYCAPPQLVFYYTPPQLAISDHFQGGIRAVWTWMKKHLWENAKSLTAWKFILLIPVLCLFHGWEWRLFDSTKHNACWSGDKDGNSKRGSSIKYREGAEKGKVTRGYCHYFCLRFFRFWSVVSSLNVWRIYMCVACLVKDVLAILMMPSTVGSSYDAVLDLRWLDIVMFRVWPDLPGNTAVSIKILPN